MVVQISSVIDGTDRTTTPKLFVAPTIGRALDLCAPDPAPNVTFHVTVLGEATTEEHEYRGPG